MRSTTLAERSRVDQQARAAWKRLKKEKSWHDWITVGEGLLLWRQEAMHEAGVNRPEGKGYNMAFGNKLVANKLDDMDKGDRARLFDCMDNLALIEEWRLRLTSTERLKINHPSTVWRRWKQSVEPPPKENGKDEARPTLRDSVTNLSEENAELKRQLEQARARIVELEEELAAARAPG
jgi:hypothetical protein